MTIRAEEKNAILRTEKFLSWLVLSTKAERNSIPQKDFRRRVSACLRHYPMRFRVDQLFVADELTHAARRGEDN